MLCLVQTFPAWPMAIAAANKTLGQMGGHRTADHKKPLLDLLLTLPLYALPTRYQFSDCPLLPDPNFDDSAWPVVSNNGFPAPLQQDGAVETANAREELFGLERRREISDQTAQTIDGAARAWGQNDHITVATVRRVG